MKNALMKALIEVDAEKVKTRIEETKDGPVGMVTLGSDDGDMDISLAEFDDMYRGFVRLWPVIKPVKTEMLTQQREHAVEQRQSIKAKQQADRKAEREKEKAERDANREAEKAKKLKEREAKAKEREATKAKKEKEKAAIATAKAKAAEKAKRDAAKAAKAKKSKATKKEAPADVAS